MTGEISAEMLARYRATAKQRQNEREARLDARFAAAWDAAHAAVALLKERYTVDTVWVFGSLLERAKFYERSDIDLAVKQIEGRDYYRAVSALLDMTPEFSFDLVEIDYSSPNLCDAILRQGVAL